MFKGSEENSKAAAFADGMVAHLKALNKHCDNYDISLTKALSMAINGILEQAKEKLSERAYNQLRLEILDILIDHYDGLITPTPKLAELVEDSSEERVKVVNIDDLPDKDKQMVMDLVERIMKEKNEDGAKKKRTGKGGKTSD